MFMQYRRLSACQLNKAIDCQPCYRLQNNDTIMSELQILQNKDAKVPLGQPPRSSSTEALRSLDLKSLSARRFFHRCIATTSAWLGKLILTLIFSKNQAVHSYNTRRSNDVCLPLPRTNWGKQSIKLRKTGTVFQLIWKKHISYLLLNPSWNFFLKILINFELWYFN